ncbi:unnamed protein product [Heligmosomoides polygyrus]|uniref:CARD domain-containing protein n=1 Tax=Heligmosomoides polygyrus TaxID=6339 RepID=A0A183G7J2_HELPZ|nr:unnamed protein product [Heligmosomoides polygyrus]
MLSEPECRVLSRAFDVMMTDFDPKDAVVFLECSGLLSEDQAEKIEAKGTRLERLRELLRIYRRQASDCESLISYFEYAAQEHIAETLRTELEHAMDGPESREAVARLPRHVRMHKLLAGSVPRVWKHVKRERLQTAVADVLRERADLDSFFVVLHGIAGCGKSSLAATVFAEVPDLLGGCFESVIWLRDSSTDPKRARHLFADLLLMLSDAVTSDTAKIESSSSVYLCKQIQEALIDRPNLIVVLDDVVQEETVKLANQFGTQSAVNAAFSVSSGNAALLTMLKKMADGRAVR